jgi:peptide/nickel transport system permease protein
MTAYTIRRLLLALPTLIIVSVFIFGMMRLIPGDPATLQVGDDASQERIAALREQLGLGKPVYTQYFSWLADVMRLDLGTSLRTGQPVSESIVRAVPVSAQLAVMAVLLSVSIGIPLGIVSAITRGSSVDYGARLIAILGLSIPSFVLGTLLLYLPSIWFGWLPPIGYVPIHEDPSRNLLQFMLPAATIGYRSSGITARMTRSSLLEVLGQDYIRTATAKGLLARVVIVRHALKNALIPVTTIVGDQLGSLLAGAVISETIFSLPGVGRLFLDAAAERDYTMIQGVVLFIAAVVVFTNLAVDLLYAALDPRIKYS